MKHFTKTLGNIFTKYMNFEEKPMIPLSDDEKTHHDNAKVCFLCNGEFCIDKKNIKYLSLYQYLFIMALRMIII